jgi:hypothetical protein
MNVFSWQYGLENRVNTELGVPQFYLDAMEKSLDKWGSAGGCDCDDDDYCDCSKGGFDPEDNTAVVGFITEKGKFFHGNNTACHAQLNEVNVPRNDKLRYLQNIFLTPFTGVSNEDHLTFVNWLINDSPYADIFVVKDPSFVFNNYYVCDANQPANLLVGGMVCGRFSWEEKNANAFPVWARIVKLGGDPTVAFAFAHVFRAKDYSDKIYPVMASSGEDYHNVVAFSRASMEKVKRFVKNIRNNLEPLYSEALAYERIENVWEKRKNLDYNADYDNGFYKLCNSIVPKSKIKADDYNIFRPLMTSANGFKITNDEDLMNVFDQVREELYE